MKISKLETFTNRYVCFVRVTTDSGAAGWGQTSTYNADITALIFHRQVAPWALGASEPNRSCKPPFALPIAGGKRNRHAGDVVTHG